MCGSLQRSYKLNGVQPTDCILFRPLYPDWKDNLVSFIQKLYIKRYHPEFIGQNVHKYTQLFIPISCDALGAFGRGRLLAIRMYNLQDGVALIKRPRGTIDRKQLWEMEAECLTDFGLHLKNPQRNAFLFWSAVLFKLLFRRDKHSVFVNNLKGFTDAHLYAKWLDKAGVKLSDTNWFPARIATEVLSFSTLDRVEV
jgi:hypothetical protein